MEPPREGSGIRDVAFGNTEVVAAGGSGCWSEQVLVGKAIIGGYLTHFITFTIFIRCAELDFRQSRCIRRCPISMARTGFPVRSRRRRQRTSTVVTLRALIPLLWLSAEMVMAFVGPSISVSPLARAAPRRAVEMMAIPPSNQAPRKPPGSFVGRILRRVLGTVGGVVGLSVAPLPREKVEEVLSNPEAAFQQLAEVDVSATMRETADDLRRSLESIDLSSPSGIASLDYESTMKMLASRASSFTSSVQESVEHIGEVDLASLMELVKAGNFLEAVTRATGADAVATSEVLQGKGAEWFAALDGRVEEAANGLGDMLGGANGVLPEGLAAQDMTRSVAFFLKQAAVNPALRMQTEETLAGVLVAGLGLASARALFDARSSLGASMTGPPAVYDPALIDAYFGARPRKVLNRLVSGLTSASSFLSGLLVDYVMGTGEEKAPERAKQLTALITELGPVFIKVAQLISVRPDIVGPVYLKELQSLQDQVRPFSSREAQKIIAANLPKGVALKDVYKNPDTDFYEPVAAASLGQVYRAELVDGKVVAVKVQRPNMLETITLDLYTIRLLCNVGKTIPRFQASCTSFIEVLNNWGGRFQQEIDYVQEKKNTRKFAKAMGAFPLVKDAVVVPEVYETISSRDVLVTEWIEGRKIQSFDKSDPNDKEKLEKILAVMLNSYLVQLLDTGILHAVSRLAGNAGGTHMPLQNLVAGVSC